LHKSDLSPSPQHLKAVGFRSLLQQAQVAPPVIIGEERVLTVVAPLGNVVRHPGNDDLGDTWHRDNPYHHRGAMSGHG